MSAIIRWVKKDVKGLYQIYTVIVLQDPIPSDANPELQEKLETNWIVQPFSALTFGIFLYIYKLRGTVESQKINSCDLFLVLHL